MQSGVAEALVYTKKFGYVIDNIYSMFIYVTGIPNEQKYNLRFSVDKAQNITINGTTFTLQPFAYNTREQDTRQPIDFQWATTPYADAYKRAYQRRDECFLGTDCSRSLFAKEAW